MPNANFIMNYIEYLIQSSHIHYAVKKTSSGSARVVMLLNRHFIFIRALRILPRPRLRKIANCIRLS